MKRNQRREAPGEMRSPREIVLPPHGHQPTKAEMEEETDMPGMSDKKLRQTFGGPFKFVRRETK